ncbi:DUF7210 family protein [Caldimonas sp. KR1-144]|uniref:DUF7210 family protein n=1 Tax=Caldimonas sp. KR1-144 TaxID=3400911 RepID=UPI003C0DFC22
MSKTPQVQQQPQKIVKVKLLKDHTHAGRALKAEAELEVNEADAEWLLRKQIAVAVGGTV